jgi:hypothetical protein
MSVTNTIIFRSVAATFWLVAAAISSACAIDSPGFTPASGDGMTRRQEVRYLESVPTDEHSAMQLTAERFLKALLSQDEKVLFEYGGGGDIFFKAGKLLPAISDFLYHPDGDWLAVTSIAELGPLEAVVVPQQDHIFVILYVPKQYRENITDSTFLSSQWMKKYFACQFVQSQSGFRLYENFCFAETDGPYAEDIG